MLGARGAGAPVFLQDLEKNKVDPTLGKAVSAPFLEVAKPRQGLLQGQMGEEMPQWRGHQVVGWAWRHLKLPRGICFGASLWFTRLREFHSGHLAWPLPPGGAALGADRRQNPEPGPGAVWVGRLRKSPELLTHSSTSSAAHLFLQTKLPAELGPRVSP